MNFVKDQEGPAPLPSMLVEDRKATHGDWTAQANCAHRGKMWIRSNPNINLRIEQEEALEMIVMKISRILSGDPSHADHWDDIAGYALLGKRGH